MKTTHTAITLLLLTQTAFVSAADQIVCAYVDKSPVIVSSEDLSKPNFQKFRNDAIDRDLLLLEFQRRKYTIPTSIIDDRTASILDEEFKGDQEAFDRTLAEQGYTMDSFRQIETDKMAVQALRQAIKTENRKDPSEPTFEQFIENLRDSAEIELVEPEKIQG